MIDARKDCLPDMMALRAGTDDERYGNFLSFSSRQAICSG